MKEWLSKIDKKWQAYALAGCVCIVFMACLLNLGKIWGVLTWIFNIFKPVFFGFIIAYIINPMAVSFDKLFRRFVKKDKLRWAASVILTVIIVLLILVLIAASIVPQMAGNMMSLVDNYDHYVFELDGFLSGIGTSLGNADMFVSIIQWFSSAKTMISKLGDVISDNAEQIMAAASNIGTGAVSWALGAIFAIYFLLAKTGIIRGFAKLFRLLLSPLKYERSRIILEKFNSIFSKYIVFELLDSGIIAVLTYGSMLAFRMEDAVFISFIMGVTNLIPTFGPIIGMVFAAFLLVLVQPSAVIPFLIISVVLQLADAYVIKPKLFGTALNVPGVIILIAIVVLGKMMGIVGMLIAIPVAGILVYLYAEAFIPWLELKRDIEAFKKMADEMGPMDFSDLEPMDFQNMDPESIGPMDLPGTAGTGEEDK